MGENKREVCGRSSLAVSTTDFIPEGVLPMMGSLHPNGVPFSGFRYMKG